MPGHCFPLLVALAYQHWDEETKRNWEIHFQSRVVATEATTLETWFHCSIVSEKFLEPDHSDWNDCQATCDAAESAQPPETHFLVDSYCYVWMSAKPCDFFAYLKYFCLLFKQCPNTGNEISGLKHCIVYPIRWIFWHFWHEHLRGSKQAARCAEEYTGFMTMTTVIYVTMTWNKLECISDLD